MWRECEVGLNREIKNAGEQIRIFNNFFLTTIFYQHGGICVEISSYILILIM